jgi:hypothetical protein
MFRSTKLLVPISTAFASLMGWAWWTPAPAASSDDAVGGLVINEVHVGGLGTPFIELRNLSSKAQALSTVTIESSQGVISLASAPPVPAGGFFTIARSPASAAGLTPDGRTLLVGSALLHVMKDTLLLKDSSQIVDAVSYGTTRDTSARYSAAVGAGQFGAGQFVNTSSCYTQCTIGRKASSSDSNNLGVDWDLHGGANSFNASPGEPNAASLTAEKDTVQHFQEIFNQALVNGIGFDVQYADHLQFTAGNPSTTQHEFHVDAGTFGLSVLSGASTDQFVALSNGQYDLVSQGVFQDGSLMISASITERVRTHSHSRSVALSIVTDQGDQYDYSEDAESTYTGAWGAYSIAHERTVIAWDGISRTTTSTQSIGWNPALAEVTTLSSTVKLSRDFPANPPSIVDYANWVAGGGVGQSPNAPYTTEKIDYQCVGSLTGSSLKLVYPTYSIDHGQFGSAVQNNTLLVATPTSATDTVVTYGYDFVGPTNASVEQTIQASIDFATLDIALNGEMFLNGASLATFSQYIDPLRGPAAVQGGGVWAWVKWGAATFVTGAACALGTTATAIGTGLATVTTWGATTPLMLGGTGAAAGACAVASTAVGNSLWPN